MCRVAAQIGRPARRVALGAAAVLLTSVEEAAELGVRPRARMADQTTVGYDPVTMLEGPIPATATILERNGMTISDIDLIEINEGFASVLAAWLREAKPDMDRVDVNGGAIALGHPLGSTGGRLIRRCCMSSSAPTRRSGCHHVLRRGLGTGTLIQPDLTRREALRQRS